MSQSVLSPKPDLCLRVAPVTINWHNRLPIFASAGALKAEGDDYGWIGGVDLDGDLRCILPYTVIRKAGLHMARFRTATIPIDDDLEVEQEKSFLTEAVEHFRRTGADLILPSPNTAIFRAYPASGFAAPYGTVIVDLSQPEADLWSKIRATHRQNIRKAEKTGVEIKCGIEYLDPAYALIRATMKRSGASFRTYDEFKRRILGFGENNIRVFVALLGGTLQGCMVAPFSLHTAYDCYAGSITNPVRGAMHLLHWEAIRYFRALGVRFFDFQGIRIDPDKGSKQDGIANYKRGFGGSVIQGYTWKYPLRPLKSAAYSLAVRLLMGGDTVDQERHKLRPSASAS